MRQQQAQEVSDKTNRRLGMLSVMSVIFLPLTLLTGIFGMNFEHMPSLTWRWSYPALLVLKITTAATLWRNFKKHEWIYGAALRGAPVAVSESSSHLPWLPST